MLPLIAVSMSSSVGFGVLLQQRRRLHDLAGLAVAALRHVERRARRPGRGWLPSGDKALDGGDLLRPRRRRDGVWQARTAVPSRCTVQAPHRAMPQPNLVPVRPSSSRRNQSSGMSGSPSKRCSTPFTVNVTMSLVLSSRSLKDLRSTELGRNGTRTPWYTDATVRGRKVLGCQMSPRPSPRRREIGAGSQSLPYVILRRTWQGRKRARNQAAKLFG